MAQQVINNLEGGLPARSAINANFTELYSKLAAAILLDSVSTNQQIQIPQGNYLFKIYILQVSGTPTVSIGTTGGASDVYPTAVISVFDQTSVEKYFPAATNLFVTVTGGTVSIIFDAKPLSF